MSFEEYKHNIEKKNSDVFFVFIYYLYTNKPFNESSIKTLKLLNNGGGNSSFCSSVSNSSVSDCGDVDGASIISSGSNTFRSFIQDIVDVDIDEIERDCGTEIQNNEINDNENNDNLNDEEKLMRKLTEKKNSIKIPKFESNGGALVELKADKDYISSTQTRKGDHVTKKMIINSKNNFNERQKIGKSKDYSENFNFDSVKCDNNNNLSISLKVNNDNIDNNNNNNITKENNISNSNIEKMDSINKIEENFDNNIYENKVNEKIKINYQFYIEENNNLTENLKILKSNLENNPNNNNNESNKNLELIKIPTMTTISESLPNYKNPIQAELINQKDILHEGYIFKTRKNNNLRRYFVALIGNDLIYFNNKNKSKLKGMHNISGTYVEKGEEKIHVKNDGQKKNEKENPQYYYEFQLLFNKKARSYYCTSEEDVTKWISVIKKSLGKREIKDHYIFGDKLGRGKFGVVTLGTEKKTGKNYAIKTIGKNKLEGIEQEMVRTEVEIMFFCRHSSIVKCYDHFEDYENIYMIVELLTGGTLINFLSVQESILPENKIRDLILQIAKGIKYLHHFGILHRDLKPENIMMSTKNYKNAIVKIVDFGLSKILGIKELSNDSYGTLSYAAPQIIKKDYYNNTIDVWSIGIILYYLIAGYLPFNDKNNNMEKIASDIAYKNVKFDKSIWSQFSPHVIDLVNKCLEKEMEKRLDIKEFLDHKWFEIDI